jgi:hypothetical protein
MTYVEWLRVWRVLKVTAIVLVVLEVLLLSLRISLLAFGPHSPMSFIHGIEVDPGSHVTHTAIPGGTRTVIDNAKEDVHIVIDDRGYLGKRIQIVESKERASNHPESVAMGDIHVNSQSLGTQTVTTIDTGQPEDLGYYFAIAAVVGLIIATVLGAPFARENDGHLEIAMTKPFAREPMALSMIGADLVGVLGAWVMTIVFLIVGHTIFEVPHFVFGSFDAACIALGLAACAAWYGMLCAATASIRRGYGAILGFAWPIALVVLALSKINMSGTQLGQVVHALVTPLAFINPLTYFNLGGAVTVNGEPTGSLSTVSPYNTTMLAILAVVYLALAVLQWRRVEA